MATRVWAAVATQSHTIDHKAANCLAMACAAAEGASRRPAATANEVMSPRSSVVRTNIAPPVVTYSASTDGAGGS